jgi:hypothetical protein
LLLTEELGGNVEAFDVHGLTVLSYQLQHPDSAKPWTLAMGQEVLRQIFEDGQDQHHVLAEHCRQETVDRWRAQYSSEASISVIAGPVPSEMSIADIDPSARAGHAKRVLT